MMKYYVLKILAAVIAIQLIVSPIGSIFASDNDSINNNFGNKAGLLAAMDIIKQPLDTNQPVTRAAFAEMVLKILKINADGITDGHVFYDVSSNDPLYGVVSAVYSLGIIKGYEDNTFRPQQAVSAGEAAVMLLKCMGYDKLAEQHEGSIESYYLLAADAGLLKSVSISMDDVLTADNAVYMIFNCLNAPIFKRVSYGNKDEYTKDNGCTILSEYHDIYKDIGIVNATSITSISGKKLADNEIKIDDTVFSVTDNSLNKFLGYKVDYYYREKSNGDYDIVYMSKHKNVNEIIIKADDIISFESNILSYYTNEKENTEKEKIAYNQNIILNGKHITEYDKSIFMPDMGTVRLVSNDGGENFNVVFVDTFTNYSVQSASFDDNILYIQPKYYIKKCGIDLNDKNVKLNIMDSDGKKITIDDFTSMAGGGAVVSIFSDKYKTMRGHKIVSDEACYITIVVTGKSVSGTITGMVGDESLMIDGETYYISSENYLYEDNETVEIGTKGTFYLDAEGNIAAWSKDAAAAVSDFVYGYIIKGAASSESISKKLELKVLTQSGEIKIFQCKENLIVNDGSVKDPQIAYDLLAKSAKLIDEKMT